MTLIKQICGHKKESNDIRKNKNSVTGAGRLLFFVWIKDRIFQLP